MVEDHDDQELVSTTDLIFHFVLGHCSYWERLCPDNVHFEHEGLVNLYSSYWTMQNEPI